MIKKIPPLFFFLLLMYGCGGYGVTSTVSDQYRMIRPHTVAVLPVEWTASIAADDKATDKNVSYLFRTMVFEKLHSMSYKLITLETVDDLYLKSGRKVVAARPVNELADALGVDAVMAIRVTDWDTGTLATFASLKVKAVMEMRSNKGVLLWSAAYETSESDAGLDSEPVEMAVVKAYEPRIQRFVDAIFSTLPQADVPSAETKFFEWLP